MVPQPAHDLEGLPAIVGAEQRRGLDADVHHVRLVGACRRDLPGLLDAGIELCRKLEVGRLGLDPCLAQIVAVDHARAPEEAGLAGQDAAFTRIERNRGHRSAVGDRVLELAAGVERKQAFGGTDQQQDVGPHGHGGLSLRIIRDHSVT